MDKLFSKKAFLIALSIFCAVILWLVADPISKTTVDVTIVYVNEDKLADGNLHLMDGDYTKTVSVTVTGRKEDINKVTSSKFEVIADFSKIDDFGNIELNEPVYSGNDSVTITSYTPTNVKRNVEAIDTKSFNIVVNQRGAVADGYKLFACNLSQDTFNLELLESQISVVNSVEVTVNLAGRSSSYKEQLKCVFKDAGGNAVSLDMDEEPTVEVEVIIGKEFPVELVTEGIPASGYMIESTSILPDTVKLYSIEYPEYIDMLEGSIKTKPISVEGKNALMLQSALLDLPEEVQVYGNEDKTVTASIRIVQQPVVSLPIDKSQIKIENMSVAGGWTYTILNDHIKVDLRGEQSLIDSVNPEELDISIDAATLISGTYKLDMTINGLPDDIIVAGQSEIELKVSR